MPSISTFSAKYIGTVDVRNSDVGTKYRNIANNTDREIVIQYGTSSIETIGKNESLDLRMEYLIAGVSVYASSNPTLATPLVLSGTTVNKTSIYIYIAKKRRRLDGSLREGTQQSVYRLVHARNDGSVVYGDSGRHPFFGNSDTVRKPCSKIIWNKIGNIDKLVRLSGLFFLYVYHRFERDYGGKHSHYDKRWNLSVLGTVRHSARVDLEHYRTGSAGLGDILRNITADSLPQKEAA